jgi:transcriptional regulator with XRE-family HTH domain
VTNALAAFLRQRIDERGLRNRDVVMASGLSRQVVSKWVADQRDHISRLPDRATLEGFARALGVPTSVLLGKAVEALGLGYTSGDFVNSVGVASDEELLAEVQRRLTRAERARQAQAIDAEVEELLQALQHTAKAQGIRLDPDLEQRVLQFVEEQSLPGRTTQGDESSSGPGVSA